MAEFRAPAKQEYPHRGQGTETRAKARIQGPGPGSKQQRAKTLGESDQLKIAFFSKGEEIFSYPALAITRAQAKDAKKNFKPCFKLIYYLSFLCELRASARNALWVLLGA